MGILDTFKANKAIDTLLGAASATSPEAMQAVLKLKQIGAPAIPKLLEAYASAHSTKAIDSLLVGLLTDDALPLFIDGLCHDDRRVVQGTVRVLAKGTHYDPNRLMDFFEDPAVPKSALAEILSAHRAKIDHRVLLNLLDKVSTAGRPVLYGLLDNIATAEMLPDLLRMTHSVLPGIRAKTAQILARFHTLEARDTLVALLQDGNKQVRQVALEGLAQLEIPVAAKPICALLRDPDVTVQAKAIETLVKIRDAATVKYLIEILQDESEYVRRAAVEVLNEVGDHRAIKDLLMALRDQDWWVKVRAADALGTIGGPRVVEAVMRLIKDDDEFLRRTAVEILNTSKDGRAFEYLVEALKDPDWWVRERAADALANLRDPRAVQPLEQLLDQDNNARRVAIRALAAIGDKNAIKPLLNQLQHQDTAIRTEVLRALEALTDADHARQVQTAITELLQDADTELTELANRTMQTLVQRYDVQTAVNPATPSQGRVAEPAPGDRDVPDSAIRPSLLQAGDVLAQRYRVIRKVGKGAFGVVVLVTDLAVNEQMILKFLDPQNTAYSDLLQRFKQEMRYARRITHENVIRIYDFVSFGDAHAISMEYFPSHSLADELRSEQRRDQRNMLKVLAEICKGMAAAQNAGVVHRDLKPANILIDDEDVVKIVDFGIAAVASSADSRLTKNGVLIGTPTYMAPEQAHGRDVDSRTDIYSLGIIMYEIFTGRPPYTGDYPMATLFKHIEGKAEPPSRRNPAIAPRLEQIIQRAMALEPDDRFQDFDELRAALEDLAEEQADAAD